MKYLITHAAQGLFRDVVTLSANYYDDLGKFVAQEQFDTNMDIDQVGILSMMEKRVRLIEAEIASPSLPLDLSRFIGLKG